MPSEAAITPLPAIFGSSNNTIFSSSNAFFAALAAPQPAIFGSCNSTLLSSKNAFFSFASHL
jgi:hypothetical protein